jgi:putative OPT family oligopeptide transporter
MATVPADLRPPPTPVEDAEKRWLRTLYRPGVPQLTVRAVVVGMLLGALMCLSNLYVVLKTGWSFGVTLTACVVAFALFRLARSLGLVRREFGMLENNAMGSVASSAGFMTGGGNLPAMGALLVLTGLRPEPVAMVAWLAVIAMLGVFTAVPIKRQLINVEELPFPTGTATAETLHALHGEGNEATRRARKLGWAAVFGGALAFVRDLRWLPFHVPASTGLPFTLRGLPAAQWTLNVDWSVLLVGGGALLGFRTGWSMLLGGLLNFCLLAPWMHDRGVFGTVSFRSLLGWSLWPGAALMIAAGLLGFAFQWRAVLRALSGLLAVFRKSGGRQGAQHPIEAVEVSLSWFGLAYLVLGPMIVALMVVLFGFPLWAAVLALPLAVMLGVVAARVTGETDVTPSKALGPVTQLVYGAALPGQLIPNITGANVTAGAGLHAADLLTDLKSGWLLGANPRQQLVGQLFGAMAGALAVVPAFNLLVPSAESIGNGHFPAPSVQVWASVSRLLSQGAAQLHPAAQQAIAVGLCVGAVLTLLERFLPRRLRAFVPSPTAVGVSFMIPFANSLAFFVGALVAEIVRRRRPAEVDGTVTPIASGFIAGESLMGVAIAIGIALLAR